VADMAGCFARGSPEFTLEPDSVRALDVALLPSATSVYNAVRILHGVESA